MGDKQYLEDSGSWWKANLVVWAPSWPPEGLHTILIIASHDQYISKRGFVGFYFRHQILHGTDQPLMITLNYGSISLSYWKMKYFNERAIVAENPAICLAKQLKFIAHYPRGPCQYHSFVNYAVPGAHYWGVTGLCAGNSAVNTEFPHKGSVARKMFPSDDVIMPCRGDSIVTSAIAKW